jgi:transcriptional regulator with XRE-family HTH domain
MNAGGLIRQARIRAGLTQDQLAHRMGTTQSAVARLERSDSSPRLKTLERALLAAGHTLSVRSSQRKSTVDETLIERQLRLSPEERLKAFEAAYEDVRKLAGSVA